MEILHLEAAVRRCFSKKLFYKIGLSCYAGIQVTGKLKEPSKCTIQDEDENVVRDHYCSFFRKNKQLFNSLQPVKGTLIYN